MKPMKTVAEAAIVVLIAAMLVWLCFLKLEGSL